MRIFVVDFEGSLKYGVIEYGVVVLENGSIVETFTGLCKPEAAIHPKDIQVHGLRDDMLRDKPGFDTFGEQFQGFRCEGLLAAHHASVENAFLNKYWHTLPSRSVVGHPFPCRGNWGPWIDSRLVYRSFYQLDDYSLTGLIRTFQLTEELEKLADAYCPSDRKKSHCALYDALASALLLIVAGESLNISEETWLRVSQPSAREDFAQGDLF